MNTDKNQPRVKGGKFGSYKYTPEVEEKITGWLKQEIPVEKMILMVRMECNAKTDITAYKWIEKAALKLGKTTT